MQYFFDDFVFIGDIDDDSFDDWDVDDYDDDNIF